MAKPQTLRDSTELQARFKTAEVPIFRQQEQANNNSARSFHTLGIQADKYLHWAVKSINLT